MSSVSPARSCGVKETGARLRSDSRLADPLALSVELLTEGELQRGPSPFLVGDDEPHSHAGKHQAIADRPNNGTNAPIPGGSKSTSLTTTRGCRFPIVGSGYKIPLVTARQSLDDRINQMMESEETLFVAEVGRHEPGSDTRRTVVKGTEARDRPRDERPRQLTRAEDVAPDERRRATVRDRETPTVTSPKRFFSPRR